MWFLLSFFLGVGGGGMNIVLWCGLLVFLGWGWGGGGINIVCMVSFLFWGGWGGGRRTHVLCA